MAAELVLHGGSIVTLDPRRPRATGLAVAEGRIVALGDADEDFEALRDARTRVVELRGRVVVPGFVDAHVHFGSFALGLQQIDLDGAASLEAGLAAIREFVARPRGDSGPQDAGRRPASGGRPANGEQPANAGRPANGERLANGGQGGDRRWLRGRGWDRNRWRRLPTARELDTATGDRPAALSSHDGHSLWLNSAAMTAVDLTRATEAPPGGVIERDVDGQPTGVLFENAQDLVRKRIPEPTVEDLAGAIRSALPRAAQAGLTGIHNIEDERSLAAFKAIEAAGDLSLRVYHGVRRGQLRAARDLGLATGAGSDKLRIGPVKLFSDGALGSRTAYLLEPYEGAADGYRGVPTLEPEEIVEDMRVASEVGLDVAVHAIGDAAVRRVLDAVEAARRQAPDFRSRMVRIEHAQLVHPDDVPRFKQLGVIASMQPIHAIADWRAADVHWGSRARHGYAWRSLLDAGALLAFGTDAPVEKLEPLASLDAATSRLDPNGEPHGGWYLEQRLTPTEALHAYTSGSAAAERASERRGSIAVGKDADLVVLSGFPADDEAARFKEVRVEMTVVGGEVVFEA
jgi:predicted amidohydrolase YtcJ